MIQTTLKDPVTLENYDGLFPTNFLHFYSQNNEMTQVSADWLIMTSVLSCSTKARDSLLIATAFLFQSVI